MSSIKNNWIRPWNMTKFDNIANKDERFFSIVTKGFLSYLTRHIMLYNKPINHYILSTGSEYLYVENNGYEFSWNQISGEDTLYSKLPRCTVELEDFQAIKEELSAPYSRGFYERIEEDKVIGFNAELKRLPVLINFSLHYQLSNFNEAIVLTEELFNDLIWLKYFKVSYLGLIIECSIEFPDTSKIEYNKIDFGTENKQKSININLIVKTNYPIINQRSEVRSDKIIYSFDYNTEHKNIVDNETYLVD